MTHFEFLSVAVSFVLGLAVTVLLRSAIIVFRAQRTTRMNWLPFAWAFYVLIVQFTVWWEIYAPVSLERWSFGASVILLLVALLLFVACALALPAGVTGYPEDLEE